MDKLLNQLLGKLSITTEKSNFSKSVHIRRCQEDNHQVKNKLVLAGQRKTKKILRPFIMTQRIIITPIKYLKVTLDTNFGTKRELSLLFHLQQIGFGKTNQNYQELFNHAVYFT